MTICTWFCVAGKDTILVQLMSNSVHEPCKLHTSNTDHPQAAEPSELWSQREIGFLRARMLFGNIMRHIVLPARKSGGLPGG